ncbi:PqiC family protein [Aliikangiella coralliicola]|uniref:ABC-type transport auxiliary lipoprotein component domain-containing protein n=1 Tax=Aliikangiella coralliicola TaxID=2592383 RepID=A0A545UE79_9GAMM|nr:ABC-type transport auxiliary lipoprotein family protein [Aliikangiella coralliicola]TQV87787.1 hypothetical protein FLL46_10395 [Aliikangiella coralliicola]
MNNYNILSLCLVLMLSACSSAPKKDTHYYLLNNHVTGGSLTENIAQSQSSEAVLIKIRLPEYLMQPNLVIQMGEHRLHYARYHLWAENLQPAITKALVFEMKKSAHSVEQGTTDKHLYHFVEREQAFDGRKSITLQIDHFYPDDRSKVIISGKYWLTGFDNVSSSQSQAFYIEKVLQNDGYPHAVRQMRGLVSELAVKLVEKLRDA